MFLPCSDPELETLSEELYHDAKRIVQEVALYLLLSQGEADRHEPPGETGHVGSTGASWEGII